MHRPGQRVIPPRDLDHAWFAILGELAHGDRALGQLIAFSPDEAVVQVQPDRVVAVARATDADAPRLRHIVENVARDALGNPQAPRETAVIYLGGASELRRALGEADLGGADERLRIYHVDDAGEAWSRPTRRSSAFHDAVWAVIGARHRPLDIGPVTLEARLRESMVRAQSVDQDHRAFIEDLQRTEPFVTYCLAIVCGLAFFFEIVFGGADSIATLLAMGANAPDMVARGEIWRLLTATFLHGGPLHILMNGMVLISLGRLVEGVLGPPRFLVLYTVSGVVASLATVLFAREQTISVGASGALWGMLTATAVLAWRPAGLVPHAVAERLKRSAKTILILNIGISFIPGIDLYAHFGGGIGGALLMASGLITPRRRGGDPSSAVNIAAFACAAAMAASVIVAMLVGRPWTILSPDEWATVQLGDVRLQVDVPAHLGPVEHAMTASHHEYVFSAHSRAGYALMIAVESMPERVPTAALDRALDVRVAAAERALANTTAVGNPVREWRGGYPTWTHSIRREEGRAAAFWQQTRPRIALMMRVDADPGMLSRAREVHERIFDSIQPGVGP